MDTCPNCGSDNLDRDAVDIGVGTQYGPFHCLDCGWIERDDCASYVGALPDFDDPF